VLLERRQMAGTNDIAGSYDPDSQFVVILLHHVSKVLVNLAKQVSSYAS
jgi:hypothetical protein